MFFPTLSIYYFHKKKANQLALSPTRIEKNKNIIKTLGTSLIYSPQCFRVYGKKVLKYVPVVGWAWNMSDVIFLDRNWEKVSFVRDLKG